MSTPQIDPAHMRHHYATQFDSAESTKGYRSLDSSRVNNSAETLEAYAEIVSIWHRVLTLHHSTIYGKYTGVSMREFRGDPTSPHLKAWHARSALLSAAARTSKFALDAALTGHYSEAAALIRHVVESWTRAVHLRLDPVGGVEAYGFNGKPSTTWKGYRQVSKLLKDNGIHPESIALADRLMQNGNLGAHPSTEFLTLVRGALENQEQRYVYEPRFDRDLCGSVLDWGVLALILVVNELGHWELQPEEWHVDYRTILDDLKTLRPHLVINATPE